MATIELDMAAIMARQATLNLGTLGNVSEGKSTFVRAISGIATQKYKSEKVRNITIHLGYAGFKIWRNVENGDLSASSSTTMEVAGSELVAHYSFADCPGHEAYLATMLSGASIMDAAALIVASNNETIPQMQTEEHLMAAELMSIPHVFTIQNKLDLVSDPKESLAKIKAFTARTVAEAAPILPMSAQRGWGLEYALHHLAYGLPEPVRVYDGPLRMMVVRSFDINKPTPWTADSTIAGGVIGGTLQRGVLYPNDLVEIRPGLWDGTTAYPLLTRVGSLYCDSNAIPLAVPGGLIGVGTTLDPSFTAANGLAGHVVGTPGTLPDITVKIKGKFKAFVRPDGSKLPKQVEGDAIQFCVGIMTVKGKITKIGDKRTVYVKLVRPVCVEPGQICAILRTREGRQVLDGVLLVESCVPFESVKAWSEDMQAAAEASAKAVCERRFVVKPHEVRKEAVPLPTYDTMCDAIETLTTPERPTARFVDPEIARMPKKTAWVNAPTFLASLREVTPTDEMGVEDDFKKFVEHELATSINVKAEGQWLIFGRFSEQNIKTIIRKYLTRRHMCRECHCCIVDFTKTDRIVNLRCTNCGATNALA
jgi:translation initiation factor 2 subunit 3